MLMIAAFVACGVGSPVGDTGETASSGAPERFTVDVSADVSGADADGDLILDVDEGAGDSDGDGDPDWLDLDSDGDGLRDEGEAGDRDPATAPVDSDGDGVPDVLDLDSDDNCVPDAIEGAPLDGWPRNSDYRGLADHASVDDDGDGIYDEIEWGPDCAVSLDTDDDGLRDGIDRDSDGDTVDDMLETYLDSDRDGVMNFRDLDSDDDGLSDEEEAGGATTCFGASDADGDCWPDFRDSDADNDSLLDGDEVYVWGSDPLVADTDADGATDGVEGAAGTDPRDASERPTWVIELPYGRERAVSVAAPAAAAGALVRAHDPVGFVVGRPREVAASAGGYVRVSLVGVVRAGVVDAVHPVALSWSLDGAEVARETVWVTVGAMPAGMSCLPR
jgi:hypothetical protein